MKHILTIRYWYSSTKLVPTVLTVTAHVDVVPDFITKRQWLTAYPPPYRDKLTPKHCYRAEVMVHTLEKELEFEK